MPLWLSEPLVDEPLDAELLVPLSVTLVRMYPFPVGFDCTQPVRVRLSPLLLDCE
jgi:hypothetical protein